MRKPNHKFVNCQGQLGAAANGVRNAAQSAQDHPFRPRRLAGAGSIMEDPTLILNFPDAAAA